jgi:hypothetical protein
MLGRGCCGDSFANGTCTRPQPVARRSGRSRDIGLRAHPRLLAPLASETKGIGGKMTRTELIIQLLKVAIGIAFGAYFIWWSLEVLDRLTPEYDKPTAVVGRAS